MRRMLRKWSRKKLRLCSAWKCARIERSRSCADMQPMAAMREISSAGQMSNTQWAPQAEDARNTIHMVPTVSSSHATV